MKTRQNSVHSHVYHLAPSLVVVVGSVGVLPVVGGLNVQLGVVGMVSVVLEFSLEGSHMLSVNLEGKGPESTFPNHTSLCVLHSDVVLVVDVVGTHSEVSVSSVEPEADHN